MMLDTSKHLFEALETLALELETPRVPGEQEVWLGALQTAAARTALLFNHQLDQRHPRMFQQIVRDDQESFRQVELLKQADERNRQLFKEFLGHIERLLPCVRRIEPNEAIMEKQLEQLAEQGLEFVIEVRKQELATRVWSQEALYRETGVMD